ncbi:hypothetical protein Dimus_010837 [Dionaea muscipula]
MTVIHLKKRDVVKSKVRGVDLEFDHEKLATILGVPGKNGICEYIKEVWEESKYTKPLEITRRFANDDTIMEARRVKRRDDAPAEETEEEEERNQDGFDWEAVIDEAAVEGESGLGDKFYDAEDKEQGSPEAEFERKRANRIHDDLEKAKAENARLLALLHQAQTKPHP